MFSSTQAASPPTSGSTAESPDIAIFDVTDESAKMETEATELPLVPKRMGRPKRRHILSDDPDFKEKILKADDLKDVEICQAESYNGKVR